MFTAYLWDKNYGYTPDEEVQILAVNQDGCGPLDTYFLISNKKDKRFWWVNARQFRSVPMFTAAEPDDPGTHIKVQYKGEELTLRQLIDKLDDATKDLKHWELLYLSSREEVQALKRQIVEQEERRRT